jgi:Holliday junction resolvase
MDGGLRLLFRKHLTKVDWQAIESSTGLGIPDLNGCVDGIEFWIECKAAAHWRVKISPEQVGWAERRARRGGRVFLAARRASDELWLFKASSVRDLASQRLDAVPCLGHWAGGPARWDWPAVSSLLSARQC